MTKTNPGPIASLHQIRAGDEVAMPEAVPAGTWAIDPSASSLQFVARHMMVSKVRGRFLQFQGRILTGTDPSDASVEAWADAASLSTGDEARDEHLRSADFFDVERWPRLTLVGALKPSSTRRRLLAAQLTIRDVTCPVDFQVTLTGLHGGDPGDGSTDESSPTPAAGTVMHVLATSKVNRKDFDLRWNATIETGGVVVGDMVELVLDVTAHLEA